MTLPPVWYFALMTFGCKVNQYESQALREAWCNLGGVEICLDRRSLQKNLDAEANNIDDTTPQIILLNTCAVTAEAVADVRQAVLRLRRTWPHVLIGLAGCAVTAEKELEHTLQNVNFVVPQAEKAELLQGPWVLRDRIACPQCKALLASWERRWNQRVLPDAITATGKSDSVTKDIALEDTKAFPPFSINSFTRARPVIKVQDGCVQACTYCIVPLARGKSRSRPFEAIVAEAERLLDAGACEIILSGINLREYHYRMDGSSSFWGMLKRLDATLAPKWYGKARIRLSSLDPAQLNAEALDTLAASRLVCPHLHLSMQSGSLKVLRRMGRTHYTPEEAIATVSTLASIWPLMGLGVDMLMGFADEDTQALKESLGLVSALPLSYAHVFAYSERPKTVAASFSDHLPKQVRQDHARQMRKLVATKRQAFLERMMREPQLVVAPDGADSTKGVDAYYVSCGLMAHGATFTSRSLQVVQPMAITKEGLAVEEILPYV